MSLTNKQWLAKLNKVKDWEAVKKEADQQGGSVPDGRYRCKVTSAELTESKGSGREQINLFTEVIEEGDYQGQNIGVFLGLDEEQSLPWTIAALRRCGYKINEDPAQEIIDAVNSLNEDLPEVAIRVKKGFGNLDGLWEKLEEDEIGDEAPVEEEVVEEESTAEAEEAQVEVGTKVSFIWKEEELEGVVKEINEDEGKLKVSCNGKLYPVKAENATIVADVEPEPEEEPVEEEPQEEPEVEVKKKKPAPKKVVKPVKKNIKRR